MSDGDRAPIFVSIANIWRDLGDRERNRTGIIGVPVSNSSQCAIDLSNSRDAATYYQRAIGCYRQSGTLAAQIDRASLQADLFQQLTADGATPATIASWQTQFDRSIESALVERLLALPDDYTAHSQRINLARREIRIANTDAQFSLRDRVDTLYREAIDLGLQRQQLHRLENTNR